MSDTGFLIAAAGSNVANGSGVAWSNPGNITADDASNASFTVGVALDGDTDRLTSGTHSVSLPGGAIINGIEVQAELGGVGGTNSWNCY